MTCIVAQLGQPGERSQLRPQMPRRSAAQQESAVFGRRFGHTFDLGYGRVGGGAIDETGTPLPDETVDLIAGSDAVLSGIVGRVVTVSYGPAGNGAGQRKITGKFLCFSYQVGGKAEAGRDAAPVRFVARFQQSGPVTLGTWV